MNYNHNKLSIKQRLKTIDTWGDIKETTGDLKNPQKTPQT